MSSAFSLRADLSQLGMDKASEASEAAARPAAQAGAQVFYDQVRANTLALGRKTGKLADAIYQAHSADNSSPGDEVYHVSWNARKAPHGHLVENGYVQRFKVYLKDGKWYMNKEAPLAQPRRVAGKAFVASAAAVAPKAMNAMEAEFYARMGLHLQ